jgi:pseudomonalisin
MKSTSFTNLRKTTLALAVVAAVCAGSAMATGSASSSLVSLKPATVLAHGDTVMGALPEATKIHIEVELQLRDWAGLNAFIANIGKPGQPRIMSAAEWDAKHAPTQVQAQTVVNYLKTMGFTGVEINPDRMYVHAYGSASSVSKAFLTQMAQVHTYDGRIAYANISDVQLPATMKDKIFSVAGLQTVHLGHTFAKKFNPQTAHPLASSVQGHLPHDFPSIYGDTSLAAASGVTVGIFTQGKMATTISDLNKFTDSHHHRSRYRRRVHGQRQDLHQRSRRMGSGQPGHRRPSRRPGCQDHLVPDPVVVDSRHGRELRDDRCRECGQGHQRVNRWLRNGFGYDFGGC